MDLQESAELRQLRTDLRRYFDELLTPDERRRRGVSSHERSRALIKRLGADGWLGIGWPTEFGGRGRSQWEQYVFFDEVKRAGVPVPMLALNTVGPTIMAHGTSAQKTAFLPKILAGDVEFAIGYTEPDAGTDLASLSTKAVRDGDAFRITGSKIFTTGGAQADFIWLAARTDADKPKHKGLSVFIVPTTAPGFEAVPLATIAEDGARETTVTYYDEVVVPAGNMVGQLNAGWRLITSQLNHERVALAAARGWIFQLVEDVEEWARRERVGVDRATDGWVKTAFATINTRLKVMSLLNWRMVGRLASGEAISPGEASVAKVYGTETVIDVCKLLMEVIGRSGYLLGGSEGAVLSGRVEEAYRASVVGTFGGGNNDMLKEMIAHRELGMVRTGR